MYRKVARLLSIVSKPIEARGRMDEQIGFRVNERNSIASTKQSALRRSVWKGSSWSGDCQHRASVWLDAARSIGLECAFDDARNLCLRESRHSGILERVHRGQQTHLTRSLLSCVMMLDVEIL